MAFVDGLTGLWNRRYLDSWIEQRLRWQNRFNAQNVWVETACLSPKTQWTERRHPA
ncbi:hypothetical protein [Paraburkholderia caribensis]|uniref:hypothetical protein n=1 Tax=Paraburkholderia caribensis TaxID=75105 RepID=UPI0015917FFA|nr:hypothetical protein [Paraburkholderia caribensis]